MTEEPIREEILWTIANFDIKEIIDFEMKHQLEIVRGTDYLYTCVIDKKHYATSLTSMHALIAGVKLFKQKEENGSN